VSRKAVGEGRTLLLVEDDEGLRERMSVAFARRGFEVTAVATAAEGCAVEDSPELALVDLRLPDADGLAVLRHLLERDPRTNVVVLTGYGSIATALEAVRRGATWFLTKPADADEVLAAFARGDEDLRAALGLPSPDDPSRAGPPLRAPSLERMEWEHIHRVLADCAGNVTHAAEALGIHRRSLQRKLGRRPGVR
jgi:two-component system response regulator RegA